MIQLMTAAFAMGIIGSFHCIGMCGPLALSLPLPADSNWAEFSGSFLYNLGRVITYAVLGLILGTMGKTAAFFGYQQWLSILLGLLVIVFIIIPKRFYFPGHNNFAMRSFGRIRKMLSDLFLKRNYTSLFAIGLLNGLLPCGLVYMAAATATATGDIINSMLFMMFFGVGSLPLMWSLAFFGNYIGIELRKKIRTLYPYVMLLMACLLILRGMGLGIPYVSPQFSNEHKVVLSCGVKQ